MFYIYKHTHRESGRSYIGKTNDISRRLCEHRHHVKKGSKYHFHNALRKYGEDSFGTEILWQGECESIAYENEVKLIAEYDTFHNGYNMTEGGDSGPSCIGRIHTDETKLKMSQSNMGISRGKGVPKNESHKKAIGAAHKGKPKNYKNGRTKKWEIKQPDGSVIKIENLQQYEKSLGLATNAIRNTIKTKKPHYSGYQLVGG